MGFWKYVLGTPRNYALTKHFFKTTPFPLNFFHAREGKQAIRPLKPILDIVKYDYTQIDNSYFTLLRFSSPQPE